MPEYTPTPYRELAEVLANLPLLLREARRARSVSMRTVERETGVSIGVLSRLERGEDCSLRNAGALLQWMDGSPGGTPRAIEYAGI